MKKDVILSIDCGTSGIRGILFDDLGNELGKAEVKYTKYYSLDFQWKEAPPDMFWEGFISVTKEIKNEFPNTFKMIKGITLACQRDVISVADENGEPLRDFISWLDRRVIENPLLMPLSYRLLFKLILFKSRSESFNVTTHAHWIKVNEPEIWKKSYKFIFLSTYLIGKLTGKLMDSPSNTAGHVPFDFKKKIWCKKNNVKSIIIQIENEKRYELVNSCEIIGYLTQKAAMETGLPQNLPLIISGTDKGCETIGIGALSPEVGSVSLGTQATVEVTTKKYIELFPFYPSFPGVQIEDYNPEITIYHGFWMVDWFIGEFLSHIKKDKVFDLLDSYLTETIPGNNGLIHQPYWGWEVFRPYGKGSFVGLTEGHTGKHFYRGIIEGLGYGIREGLEKIESKTKVKIKIIGISGGGSRSDQVLQIMADIFNRPVYLVQTMETTGLGAAMAAFVGLKKYKNIEEAADKMVRKTRFFEPNIENVIIYNHYYNKIYKRLYKKLKPLFKGYDK